MTTIVKRIPLGRTLTVAELDANVTNLNTAKLETTGGTLTGLPVLANQDVDIISAVYPTTKPSLNLDFTRGQLDPRVTFARNSTAAYYDGKTTAKAEENLLTYSQDFSNAIWTNLNTSASIISTVTAPDGTLTANKLVENVTANVYHYVSKSGITAAQYTFSVYVKAAERSKIAFGALSSVASYCAFFDATTGIVSSVGGQVPVTPVPVNVGNGWWRLSITPNAAGGTVFGVTLLNPATGLWEVYTGDGTSGIYLWGAQLEQRSSVTVYSPTTTAPITNYIPVLKFAPANVPRFDYDPITGKPLGLLIEEGRTNLSTNGQTIGGTSWSVTAANITVATNSTIGIDGTLSVTTLTDTVNSVEHTTYLSATIATATTYTHSFYAKAGTANFAFTKFTDGINNWGRCFNLATGTVGSTVPGYTAPISTMTAVGNGWYRCSITVTTAASYTIGAVVGLTTTDGVRVYAGTGSYIYVCSDQLEAGSFATSYIPTTTATASRPADQASMVGSNFSSWYNQSEGSMYAEFDSSIPVSAASIFSISDGTTQNYQRVGCFNGTFKNTNVSIGVYAEKSLSSHVINTMEKVASNIPKGDLVWARNGIAISEIGVAQPNNINRLQIGNLNTGAYLNGHIRKLTYYPKALSSTELQALTS